MPKRTHSAIGGSRPYLRAKRRAITKSVNRARSFYGRSRTKPLERRERTGQNVGRQWRGYPDLRTANMSNGLPATRTATLKYVRSFTIASASGELSEKIIRANAPWDPDYSAGGDMAQPLKVWADQYDHMVCHKSRIKVEPVAFLDEQYGGHYGVYLSDDNTVPYSYYWEFMENDKGQACTHFDKSVRPKHVKGSYDARTFFNLDRVQDNQARVGSLTTGLPTDDANFYIWYQPARAANANMTFTVTVWYDMVFSEPKDIPCTVGVPVVPSVPLTREQITASYHEAVMKVGEYRPPTPPPIECKNNNTCMCADCFE